MGSVLEGEVVSLHQKKILEEAPSFYGTKKEMVIPMYHSSSSSRHTGSVQTRYRAMDQTASAGMVSFSIA